MPRPSKKAPASTATAPAQGTAPAVNILTLDEVSRLDTSEAARQFADRAHASEKLFVEMGKLHHQIEATLPPTGSIYALLRAMDVTDGTISNASYASKVIAKLVLPGHLDEPTFNGLSFQACFNLVRVMSAGSKKQLTPEEAAALVIAAPKSVAKEAESLYNTGITLDEAKAQAEAAERREKEERERREKEEADRKAQAEADRIEREKAEAAARAAAQARAEAEAKAAAEAAKAAAEAEANLTKAEKKAAEKARKQAEAEAAKAAEQAKKEAEEAARVAAEKAASEAAAKAKAEAEAEAQAKLEHERERLTREIEAATAKAKAEAERAQADAAAAAALVAEVQAEAADLSDVADVLETIDEIAIHAIDLDTESRKLIFEKLNEAAQAIADTLNTELAAA